MSISQQAFSDAELYVLSNDAMEVAITNYGATIVSIKLKDRNGIVRDVVLGYDSLDGYKRGIAFFGTIAGRYANRINNGKFKLNGKTYILDKNDGGKHHLHGGNTGFYCRMWDAASFSAQDDSITFTLDSHDGDGGYPGNVRVAVRYTLVGLSLNIELFATSDADTVMNLTNHSYFNLNGHDSGDILMHKLTVNAKHIVCVDEDSIPTGELLPVKGTCFDFSTPTTVGSRISDSYLANQCGYDHSFADIEPEAAILTSEQSGITMVVRTNKPALQFYSGNYLNGEHGKGGAVYNQRAGLCLETHFAPDSPNRDLDTCLLKAGEEYRYTTSFEFSVE